MEDDLVNHILELELCLFGLTCTEVSKLAFSIAEANGVQHRFNHGNKMAGIDWLMGFKAYHKKTVKLRKLSLEQPQKRVPVKKSKACNKRTKRGVCHRIV